jgi:non-canonical (house-cleaning) NTP pyrophosphatase
MKIAVGSTSNQKIGYLEEVLKELEIKACLIPFEVSSEISSQPLSSQETKKGSINRAKKAFSNSTDCDFAIGIEVGLNMKCYVGLLL